MNPPTDFLSCDWGTSSFRLRLVVGADLCIAHEIRSAVGIKSLHDQALAEGRVSPDRRAPLFAAFLRARLEELSASVPPPSSPWPLVLSGMASSTVGWKELPYASAPFPLDGRGACVGTLDWDAPAFVRSTLLVSGVATGQDMMRGEETEILGLMSAPEMARFREQCLLLLPGTHSKHARIASNNVTDWRTFMTGELFDVLGRHSLLRASVDLAAPADEGEWTPAARDAFLQGVRQAREEGLAASLFRVRTRAVLSGIAAGENAWFLSGLLIGAELAAGLPERPHGPVVLAATGCLSGLYAEALPTFSDSREIFVVPPARMNCAVVAGQASLLRRIGSTAGYSCG